MDQVVAALEQQVERYRTLAKLAELQHLHVQQGQTEELLGVLQRRQAILDELARLEQTVSPARRQWGAYVSRLSDADRARAESLMAETRDLLERITAGDRNDALVLQQRKLNVGRQMQANAVARQVNRNYAATAYARPTGGLDVAK